MTEQTTIITFLLDETGSMNQIKDDTIGGFNQYLTSLQDPTYGPVHFTLIKFDSNHTDIVCQGVPATQVPFLSAATYTPGASTPLIDAAYKTITATEAVAAAQPEAKVLIVIQTDGEENASRQYTVQDLQDVIKGKTAAGWGFLFLGAGLDAFQHAGTWGLHAAQTLSYDRGKSAQTFAAVAEATTQYRSGAGAQSLAFTDTQRTAAGDRWHQDSGTAGPPQGPAAPTSSTQGPSVIRPARRPSLVDDIVLADPPEDDTP